MKDRIRPPKDLDKSVLDQLKEDGIIKTKQKGMMLAAAIGYALEGPESGGVELDKVGEGIRLEYFKKAVDDDYIDALAVASVRSLDVLQAEQQQERIHIFERYAHRGLEELKKVCYDKGRVPLIELANLLADLAEPSTEEILPGLEGVDKISDLI